ncbi:HAMP domain-containing sensor histidine kinase [uncultured Ruminococcus sp.]|uniref:sensor histidine kinase n=1 Tax=uncultured Ruminococcus sp. TaxID=165186 RepID=UPI0025D343B9|nr:HAMP domain-containing sensor histidine kinase [uncultured Ruminococcus sp.]
MKKKLFKQKRRLFISIAASMLVLSIIVYAVFAVTTCYSELDLLTSNSASSFHQATINMQNYDNGNWGNYLLNRKYDKAYKDIFDEFDADEQIKITDNETGAILCQTGNAVSVAFQGDIEYEVDETEEDEDSIVVIEESYVTGFGCIEFERFKKSITDAKYNEITEYLTIKNAGNGEYYELLCTEYYIDKSYLQPKSVEIVQTSDDNDWYVQDKVIKHYELKPTLADKKAKLYHQTEMHRNVIDDDFVFGKYRASTALDEYYEYINKNYYTDENGSQVLKDDVVNTYEVNMYGEYETHTIVNVAPFTYIYSNWEQMSVKPYNSEENISFICSYARKFNVLDSCSDKLIFMLVFILAVFLITGVIIGAVTWRTLKKQIEQENRLRTVTNAMSHELKTPLFIISGYSEYLEENINTDKRSLFCEIINEQTRSMNMLVSKMLDYSKLDSASFNLNVQKFSLTQLTSKILESYMIYDIKLESDGDVNIKADKKLMKSVIENLVDNAVKYTTDINDISIKITSKRFSISNPCEELTKEEINDMWQPYHRKAEHNDIEGHGLGLAMVKSILDLHKFKSGAKYMEGKITFYFDY